MEGRRGRLRRKARLQARDRRRRTKRRVEKQEGKLYSILLLVDRRASSTKAKDSRHENRSSQARSINAWSVTLGGVGDAGGTVYTFSSSSWMKGRVAQMEIGIDLRP